MTEHRAKDEIQISGAEFPLLLNEFPNYKIRLLVPGNTNTRFSVSRAELKDILGDDYSDTFAFTVRISHYMEAVLIDEMIRVA